MTLAPNRQTSKPHPSKPQAAMLQAASLSACASIRHGFFTRGGGVSAGIYASLNGGIGSHDEAALVAENRARMATAMGVEPANLLTLYQIFFRH